MRPGLLAVGCILVASCASFGATTAAESDAGAGGAGAPDAGLDAPGQAYADVVLAAKPIAYFRFEDDGTEAGLYDEVSRARIGTVAGSPGFGEVGIGGSKAMRFHASSEDYVDLGNRFGFAGSISFSIEAWLAPEPTQGIVHAVTKQRRADPKEGWALIVKDDSTYAERFVDPMGGAQVADFVTPAWRTFEHVVAIYDGPTGRFALYVNGVQTESKTSTAFADHPETPAYIGAAAPGENLYTGRIDELAIYDRVLPPGAIAQHYGAGTGH